VGGTVTIHSAVDAAGEAAQVFVGRAAAAACRENSEWYVKFYTGDCLRVALFVSRFHLLQEMKLRLLQQMKRIAR